MDHEVQRTRNHPGQEPTRRVENTPEDQGGIYAHADVDDVNCSRIVLQGLSYTFMIVIYRYSHVKINITLIRILVSVVMKCVKMITCVFFPWQ